MTHPDDSAFAAFLAARPQLQPTPGRMSGHHCGCPAWAIDGKPIFHRHEPCCSTTGGAGYTAPEVVSTAGEGTAVVPRASTLDALAAWIQVPPPAPVVDPVAAESAIRRMVTDLRFHLVKLRPLEKSPGARKRWNDPELYPALTVDEALEHVAGGGGLGALLGPSRLLVIDAEDGIATAALDVAGLRPVLRTAKGSCPAECDPRRTKVGSSHFWFSVPEGVDPDKLVNSGTKHLPGGGALEVLVRPGSMAVVPPTVLTAAAGWGYVALDHPVWTVAGLDPAPAWLLDGTADVPAGLETVRAAVIQTVTRASGGVDDEHLQRHRDAEDDVDWDSVIALAGGRLQDFGDADSCGCRILHWHTAGHRSSAYFHDCGRGKYAFIVSETMKLEIGLKRSTTTTVHLACLLLGRSTTGVDRERTMRELGVEPPPSPLSIEGGGHAPLAALEIPGATVTPLPTAVVAERPVGDLVAGVTPGVHAIPGLTGSVLHAVPDAQTRTPVDTAECADDADDDADDADGVVTPEQRARVRALRTAISARERKLATMTPGLERADHWARCTGVYLHGLVTALIVRSLVDVPPNVVLPSRQGLTISKAMGMSVNVFGVVAGPSSAGKTDTMNIAAAAIPIEGVGIMEAEDGTAEGICRTARNVEKGAVEITATGLLVAADEFDSVAEEMARPGSKLDSFSRKVWVGVAAGSNASDRRKKAPLPRHSTRVCMLYGAQPAAVAPLLGQAGRGTPQRFDFGMVGVVRRADRDPLYGSAPSVSIRVNQDRLPWAAGALPPTYTPPAADVTAAEAVPGQPQGAPHAKDPAPPINNLSSGNGGGADGGGPAGLPGYDDAPPIWVKVPPIVQELIDAEGDRAAERAADWQHAREEDALGVSGHAILLQEKLAFALATWDGVAEVTMQYWDAAGVLIEMRQLVLDVLIVEAEIARAAGNTQMGHDRGVVTAEAKAAEAAITERRVASACARLLALVDAAAAQRGAVYRKAAKSNPRVFDSGGVHLGYAARSMSRPQGGHLAAAVQRLRDSGQLTGDPIVRRPMVLTVPPAVG